MSQLVGIKKKLQSLMKEEKIGQVIFSQKGSSDNWRGDDWTGKFSHVSGGYSWGELEGCTFYVGLKGGLLSKIFPDLENISKEILPSFSEFNFSSAEIDRDMGCLKIKFVEVIATVTASETCTLSETERDLKDDNEFPGKWYHFDEKGRYLYRKDEEKTTSLAQTVSVKREVEVLIFPSQGRAKSAYDTHVRNLQIADEDRF